ncbi:MAG: PQQ-dependent sugar dehydrogenase [Thermoleophilia bacterium]|nr:PQQ-dependent sugar dehydrogenase [Thermoleophilia bacterium]
MGTATPRVSTPTPDTGVLFVTEHGPNENDELNRLQAGGEYGWPSVTGRAGIPGLVDPIAAWTPTIAPAGATFYNADLIPGWRGSFLFVTLKEQDLRRLTPADAEFMTVHSEEILFDGAYGRLRAIRVGPDGSLYISTSNRDGRGSLPGSDRILRISPRTAAGD